MSWVEKTNNLGDKALLGEISSSISEILLGLEKITDLECVDKVCDKLIDAGATLQKSSRYPENDAIAIAEDLLKFSRKILYEEISSNEIVLEELELNPLENDWLENLNNLYEKLDILVYTVGEYKESYFKPTTQGDNSQLVRG